MAKRACASDHRSAAELLQEGNKAVILGGVAAPQDDPLHPPLLDRVRVLQQDLPIKPAAQGNLARGAVGDEVQAVAGIASQPLANRRDWALPGG